MKSRVCTHAMLNSLYSTMDKIAIQMYHLALAVSFTKVSLFPEALPVHQSSIAHLLHFSIFGSTFHVNG